MKLGYGETQKACRGLDASDCKDKSKGLGRLQNKSGSYGIEPLRPDKADCSRTNISGANSRKREADTGKILERLRLIENAFLSYVHGHQERLEARLDESRKEEERFLGIINELKEEIYESASNQESDELNK